MLKGKQSVSVSIGGVREDVVLRPGRWLFLAPNGWFLPDYSDDYTVLGMVFRADRLRYLINDHDASVGHRPPRCWYHLQTTPSDAHHQVARTLATLAEDHPESSAAEPLFRAILSLGHELLQRPVQVSPRGSHHTYHAIVDYLHAHCQDAIDRNLVAQVFGLHPGHISRLFQQHGKEGFNEMLNRMRLERAAELLSSSNLPVQTVAEECGYGSAVNFIRRFRQSYGVTPGRYRES